MEAAEIVLLIGVAIAVAAIALYLIAIALILKRVYDRLNIILGAVNDVVEKSAPAGEVIAAINADLAAGHKALDGAVHRLEERMAHREAEELPATTRTGPAESGGGWWRR